MNWVAFDTATTWLCVSACGPAGQATRAAEAGTAHAERLLDTIALTCQAAGFSIPLLGGVICGCGPGSFTGLRIALATAKGLAIGLSCPLVTVPTLDAMASSDQPSDSLLAMLDGKKNRYYGTWYQNGQPISDYLDLSAQDLANSAPAGANQIKVCGPAAQAVADITGWPTKPFEAHDLANRLLQLGLAKAKRQNFAPLDCQPLYVRISDAEMGITRPTPK